MSQPAHPNDPLVPPSAEVPMAQAMPAGIAVAGPGLMAYAPPAKSGSRKVWVFAAGVGTTAAALVGTYLLDAHAKENVMGWYARGIIPIGAILVGAVASVGYGVVSYTTGVRIRRGLMVSILLMQALAYVLAQYGAFVAHGPMRYKATGRQLTFPDYFHETTVGMTWKSTRRYGSSQSEPEPLGQLGYLVRFGEFAGFVFGGVIAPLVLMKRQYCDLCEAYMKSDALAAVPAAAGASFLPKFGKAKAEHAASSRAAVEEGTAKLGEIKELARRGDVEGMRARVSELKATFGKARGNPRVLRVALVRCPQCSSGHLRFYVEERAGNHSSTTELEHVELTQDFVRAWRGAKA